jgi:hypothetical protein
VRFALDIESDCVDAVVAGVSQEIQVIASCSLAQTAVNNMLKDGGVMLVYATGFACIVFIAVCRGLF